VTAATARRCPKTPQKRRYLTQEKAAAALSKVPLDQLYAPSSTYFCRACGGWHLSSVAHGNGKGRRP
jgi:hypothetical protein